MKILPQCRQMLFPILFGLIYFANNCRLKAVTYSVKPTTIHCRPSNDFTFAPQEDSTVVYTLVEEVAEFPGGIKAMYEFISTNIRFPESAKLRGVSGKCFIKFIVDSHGRIKKAEVLKGLKNCPECDEEALRVVNMMPKWKPGKQSGKAVNVYFNLPINFKSK